MTYITDRFSGDRVYVVRLHIGFLISMDKEMKPGVITALSDGRIKPWFVIEVTAVSAPQRRSADRFITRPSPYRAVNTFYLGYKKELVYAASGTIRCLF